MNDARKTENWLVSRCMMAGMLAGLFIEKYPNQGQLCDITTSPK